MSITFSFSGILACHSTQIRCRWPCYDVAIWSSYLSNVGTFMSHVDFIYFIYILNRESYEYTSAVFFSCNKEYILICQRHQSLLIPISMITMITIKDMMDPWKFKMIVCNKARLTHQFKPILNFSARVVHSRYAKLKWLFNWAKVSCWFQRFYVQGWWRARFPIALISSDALWLEDVHPRWLCKQLLTLSWDSQLHGFNIRFGCICWGACTWVLYSCFNPYENTGVRM